MALDIKIPRSGVFSLFTLEELKGITYNRCCAFLLEGFCWWHWWTSSPQITSYLLLITARMYLNFTNDNQNLTHKTSCHALLFGFFYGLLHFRCLLLFFAFVERSTLDSKYLVNTVYLSVSQKLIKENVYLGKKPFYAESRFLFIISTQFQNLNSSFPKTMPEIWDLCLKCKFS